MIDVDPILGHWGIAMHEVTTPSLGTMNDIFIVVDTVGERLVLRGHGRVDRDAVEFEHVVMQTARAGGVPAPQALTTPAGRRIVSHHNRWWSLLHWIDGDQPQRGTHTVEQAAAMGEVLARTHAALTPLAPPSAQPPAIDPTALTVRRANELLSVMEEQPSPGEDDRAALRWLSAQRDWLRSHVDDAAPTPTFTQTIHGDFHDANIVFETDAVAGVLDWDKADAGCPVEELIRAMHLSFRLDPATSAAFVAGYRSRAQVSGDALDAAAIRYGFRRDRSIWMFEELYRHRNERLRPLLNRDAFVPFENKWEALRGHL